MKCTTKVKLTAAVRKLSQLENFYHEISFIEDVISDDDKDFKFEREWQKVFYPHDMDTNLKEDLIGKEVEITFNFYPVKRQVGDKEYTNIAVNIVAINPIVNAA